MKKILIISTGGTFNKIYNPISGNLIIDKNSNALKEIAKHWLMDFKIINIIGKDSLDISDIDREEILQTIQNSKYQKIIIVHGTDTIDKTAKYLDNAKLDKIIVLTGAMVPFSIDPIEATANLASTCGYIKNINQNGIFIVMNGIMDNFKKVIKNRTKGYFEYRVATTY
ncbi:MAG: asparaginase [Sulfurovaceae bacterium]|nr:asparaginase [Sulfurovaceae bacterium]